MTVTKSNPKLDGLLRESFCELSYVDFALALTSTNQRPSPRDCVRRDAALRSQTTYEEAAPRGYFTCGQCGESAVISFMDTEHGG